MQTRKLLSGGIGFLGLLFVAVQFIPVSRTNPPVEQDVPAPAEVKAILKASCYDCHSNETVWPWYSHVAPVSWLVARDTSTGRRHLNFSTWNKYLPEQQAELVAGSLKRVSRGKMPPWYYTIKHTDGKITPEKLAILEGWAASFPQ